MLFGFALGPLQLLPGVGSDGGRSWGEICDSFVRGLRCFLQYDDDEADGGAAALATGGGGAAALAVGGGPGGSCGPAHAGLLCGYVALNFVFNTLGLYLTKHGSAVLQSIVRRARASSSNRMRMQCC